MASRWRSSGMNAGRGVDFADGIAGQDITWADEESCAELGRYLVSADTVIAVAAIAAVSARRMVGPRETEAHPSVRN